MAPVTEPDTPPRIQAGTADKTREYPAFTGIVIVFGAVASLLGILGLAGMYLGIAAFRSFYPGYQTMAFSTAAILILFGAVLVSGAIRSFGRRLRAGIQAAMAAIAIIEAIELPFTIAGGHFLVEPLLIGSGNAIAGQATSPISPFTLILVIMSSISLFLLVTRPAHGGATRGRDGAGFLGLVVALAGFTVILSYLYGAPLTYGTGFVPVAAPTALAFLALGTGMVAASGPAAAPIRYFSGDSIRALLLRTFLPLTIIVILAGTAIEFTLRIAGGASGALLTASGIVAFCIIMALVVSRVSLRVGNTLEAAERERRNAEDELRVKNAELEASCEELTAAEEELRENYDELAKSRQALQTSEAQLRLASTYNRSLIEASPDPLVTIRPDGSIGDVNDATIRATGFSREALVGTDFSRYFTEPDKAKTGYEMVFHKGSVQDYPLEIRHADGKVTPVLYNASVYRDEQGIINGVFAAARDITGLKRAEQAVKAERRRLFDVLDTLPVYVCLLTPEYHMPFANRYFRETFGESKGRCCYDFLFNRTEPCEICETYTVLKTRAPHHWYWTGPNGRDYDIYDFPFTDSDGSFNILEMGIDITERKRAETALQRAHDELEKRVELRTGELARRNEELGALNEELVATQEELQNNLEELTVAENGLRESEEKYRNLFMNMTEEVHFWKLVRDDAGRIVTWRLVDANPPTLKTWGKTREEIVGKTTDEIFGPGATGHYMQVVQKIMTEGVPHSFEDYFPNLDKYFRFTSVPLGEYFITTGADVTGIRKAELELRKKNEDLGSLNEEITATQEELRQNVEELSKRETELTQALAEKEVLLSEIHHRVKNNLTAFISLLNLEGSTEDTPAGKLLRQDLQNRARSMALIHETLYKTHMYNEVDMGMYLTTLVDQIAATFKTERTVKTVVDAHGVMLDIPRATPAGLIVNELVTNSFKYAFPVSEGSGKPGKASPEIAIALSKNDGEYVMTVKDNGIGLPPEFDIATTRTLGLKLVNFLARHQMRAKIAVSRETGAGFEIRFRE